MDLLPPALVAMAAYRQFIVYVVQPDEHRANKFNKLPRSHATGELVNAHDPVHWTDFDTANAAAKRLGPGHGVGFVLTEDDPFWCLDIDNALNDVTRTWSNIAIELCTRLQGCAIEISTSGRGLHVFGSDALPIGHSTRNGQCGLELYTTRRFIALTGTGAVGDCAYRAGNKILEVVTQYFPGESINTANLTWTDQAEEGAGIIDSDTDLIERACRAKSTQTLFSGKASFVDLWEAHEDVLTLTYPSSTHGGYDASAADLALAQHLAFWTGKNCERIKKLMMQSSLYRPKYERPDYLVNTITAACARVSNVYKTPAPPEMPKDEIVKLGFSERKGATFLTSAQQVEYFKGCVYIIEDHKILTPLGILLKPDQFKAVYGGVTFQIDAANQRTTRKPFEAFTESELYVSPRAHSVCFRPDLPTGEIVTVEGRTFANIYQEPPVTRIAGDTTLFHLHLEKLLPHDPEARKHLYYYLCALVQHQGTKFQWAPFIQGVEGNGKSFISEVVEYAIGRRYCQRPRASEIINRFNDWTFGSVFATIEDMSMSDRNDEVLEAMKPLITNKRHEVEAKGEGKMMRDICVNFIINSNHKGGYRKTANDRRIAPFFTAQQSKEDLVLHGMTETYFITLFSWAHNGGFAAMAHELMTTPIPDEYNPAKESIRAPVTFSTAEAIAVGGGRIEEEIREAIGSDLTGFKGGFISAYALDQLLQEKRLSCSRQKRRVILAELGYIPHPGLKDNDYRTPTAVSPDGRRTMLFIYRLHPSLADGAPSLLAAQIGRLYETTQQGV